MNTTLAIIDILLAFFSVVGVVATTVMYYYAWKKDCCSLHVIYDLLMQSIALSMFGKNWLTAINWVLCGAGFGILSYYGHYWFINVSIVSTLYFIAVIGALWKVLHKKPAVY